MENKRTAPFIHSGKNPRTMVLDVILALIPLIAMGVFFYGVRVLFVCLISVTCAVFTEHIACKAIKRKTTIFDFTAVVTGIIVALLCSPSVPLYLPAVGSIFGILIAKMPFGGRGRNIFNPAAAGFCFLVLSAPGIMFAYPNVTAGAVPLIVPPEFPVSESLTALLKNGGKLPYNAFELLVGRYSGPLGNTFALVVAACGLYLIARKVLPLQTIIPFLTVCAAFSLLFPRGDSRVMSMLIELTSGTLIFSAVFMLSDPSTGAKTAKGRLIYGTISGIGVMLFRYFGAYEQGAPFIILLSNALVPLFDGVYFRLHFPKKSIKSESRQGES